MLASYEVRVVGAQGHASFPHTVMALGIRGPAPADALARAERLTASYNDWLRQTERTLPTAVKIRRGLSMAYRSKGERHQINGYYKANFTIEASPASLACAG